MDGVILKDYKFNKEDNTVSMFVEIKVPVTFSLFSQEDWKQKPSDLDSKT
jgi:hypothetical protein